MKKHTIATTLLLATILIGGITACTQPNSSNASQSATTQADNSPSNTAPSDTSSSSAASSQQYNHRGNRGQVNPALRQQIEAVLTADQKQQLETKLQQGVHMRQALSSLNLTSDQKTKIQEIFKASHPQRQQQSQTSSQ